MKTSAFRITIIGSWFASNSAAWSWFSLWSVCSLPFFAFFSALGKSVSLMQTIFAIFARNRWESHSNWLLLTVSTSLNKRTTIFKRGKDIAFINSNFMIGFFFGILSIRILFLYFRRKRNQINPSLIAFRNNNSVYEWVKGNRCLLVFDLQIFQTNHLNFVCRQTLIGVELQHLMNDLI